MKPRILFNCSTNCVGGGVKNSALFIKMSLKNKDVDWFYAVSPAVFNTLVKWGVDCSLMTVFEESPSKSFKSRNQLFAMSEENKVALVYTMAGPAYVNFKCKHVMGMSEPYLSHTGSEGIIKGRSFTDVLSTILTTVYKIPYARKADFWLFQTNHSRNSFVKRMMIPKIKTALVYNAIDEGIVEFFQNRVIEPLSLKRAITVLCPGGPYTHKALDSIPALAKSIKDKGIYNVNFLLTIDESSGIWKTIESLSKRFDVTDCISTTGAYDYSEVYNILEKADMFYVPSILETFSASYIEAFACKVPLVAANRSFSRDICGDGAIYVEPYNSKDAASKIIALINSPFHQGRLINEGKEKLKHFGDQSNRFENIMAKLIQNV